MPTMDTKTKIAMTFADMVRRSGIDNITVQKISDACGVSRQTFYYYFTDIMDVAEYYAHQIVDQIVADCGKCDSSQEIVRVVVSGGCKGSETMKRLFQSSFGYRWYQICLDAMRRVVERNLLKNISSYSVVPSEVSVAIDFLANGLFGICMLHGDADDAEICAMSDKIEKLMEGSIKSLIGSR